MTSPCPEIWADEVGCNVPGPHRCRHGGEHKIHQCRDCDAACIEHGADLGAVLAAIHPTRFLGVTNADA